MAEDTVLQLAGDATASRFSDDGATVYFAWQTKVSSYSVAMGTKLADVATFPAAVQSFDFSADGRYVFATASSTTNEASSGNTSSRDATIYRYDTTNGQVTSYTLSVLNEAKAFYDIEVLDNGKVLLTEFGGPNLPLYTLDPATGTFTAGGTGFGSRTITTSATGNLKLIAGIGQTITILDGNGQVLASKTEATNPGEQQIGIQAISAAANKVLIGTTNGLRLYDTNLVFQQDLKSLLHDEMGLGDLTRITFSADGTKLYGYNEQTQAIYEFSTTDWSILRGFALGTKNLDSGGLDPLVVSPDGQYLILDNYQQFRIDLATNNQITGTTSGETLIGTDRPDLIHGGDGNDRIEGGRGSDTLYGDAGDDTYVVVAKNDALSAPADVIIEKANGGNDTVITYVDFTLPTNVETIQLAQGAVATITSNANGGTLIGNDYGTLLVGGAGADVFIGGLGDDILQGGSGDTAVFRDAFANARLDLTWSPTNGGASVYTLKVLSADGYDELGAVVGRAGDTFTQMGISTLRFDDVTIQSINLVYTYVALQNAFGRAPDNAELLTFARLTASTPAADVKTTIFASTDFKALVDQLVTELYQDYGGRNPSASELTFWKGQVIGGTTVEAVRHVIVEDSLGQTYLPGALDRIYQEYGGRAATQAEITYWYGQIRGSTTLDDVRQAILADPLGANHATSEIDALYREFGGRAANSAELDYWRDQLADGAKFADIRHAILTDQLGIGHANAEIDGLYREYGGRAAGSTELDYWRGQILAGSDFADVRHAILADPLGQQHTAAETGTLYQQIFGRAPTTQEVGVWQGLILNGATFDALADALMSDAGSNGRVERLAGTAAADTFNLGTTVDLVSITGFNASADKIDLSHTAYTASAALAAAVQVDAVDGSHDVLIGLSATDTILLQDVLLSQLGTANFLI